MLKWWNNIEFANPEFLWLLLLVGLLVIWDVLKGYQLQSRYFVSASRQLPKANYYPRLIADLLKYLGFVALVLAIARPQLPLSWKDVKTEGIDIMVALDVSGSMRAQDLKPNRLEASKKVAVEFIQGRVNDRVGLVVYAGESFTQCPLTTDHDVLENLFQSVDFDMIEDGTAIGVGLANAVSRLKESDAKSKVVVLLTDGENTAGAITPITAADIANNFGVRVYTIGVGTNGKAPYPVKDFFGRSTIQNVDVKIDEGTLKQIADKTGGKYFRATDNEGLTKIYTEIDKLEKTIVEQTEYEQKDEQFYVFALLAVACFFLEFLLNKTIFRSLV